MEKVEVDDRQLHFKTLWLLMQVVYWRTSFLPDDTHPKDIPPSQPDKLLALAERTCNDPLIWEMFEAPKCSEDAETARHQLVACVHARVADTLGLRHVRPLDGYDSEHGTAQARSDLLALINLCKGR